MLLKYQQSGVARGVHWQLSPDEELEPARVAESACISQRIGLFIAHNAGVTKNMAPRGIHSARSQGTLQHILEI